LCIHAEHQYLRPCRATCRFSTWTSSTLFRSVMGLAYQTEGLYQPRGAARWSLAVARCSRLPGRTARCLTLPPGAASSSRNRPYRCGPSAAEGWNPRSPDNPNGSAGTPRS
jgi:hypothetical protein